MKPSPLPASSTGQWRACCGSSGRWFSRRGAMPTLGRTQLGNVRTSIVANYGGSLAAARRALWRHRVKSNQLEVFVLVGSGHVAKCLPLFVVGEEDTASASRDARQPDLPATPVQAEAEILLV